MDRIERSSAILLGAVLESFVESYTVLKDGGDERTQVLLGQSPLTGMTTVEDWAVRVELMAFLLHVVNRQAFTSGGAAVRDRLQDALPPQVATNLVTASWPGGDDPFIERLTGETVHNFNVAEQEYRVCASLWGDDHISMHYMERSAAVGRFIANLSRLSGRADSEHPRYATNDPGFALGLYGAVIKGLARSDLVKRVDLEAALLH